ncbi:hypothetical protein RJ640_005962 [Escallonia rubra]|uniref:Glycine-rich domain-containing protein 1 n=1 Tax=Escallonia rubra TaxID=112253 RepID=A0AA88RGD2_9ASTE|nr:hypothetical protein RJ640_005962 [Escallonia rubra]
MDRQQELEWLEAQKTVISENLVATAKKQLEFLAAVDRNRDLYDGPALEKAIHRYKNCWLPLLATDAVSKSQEGPLVVPLDCEWIWHCHRLNPVRYMTDCNKLYGRILDSQNTVSSTEGICPKHTRKVWETMYPNESYELDLSSHLENASKNNSVAPPSTDYDLVSAVKRQSPFYYQVSSSFVYDDLYLEAAVARYKGFLHLIRRNMERKAKHFCVPTYDIDLIWHSHQLLPVSYCKHLMAILGKVLEHDDTDSDRTKGEKLDVGFLETTNQWEKTFGSRYWRAGALYRGRAPSPVTMNPCPLGPVTKKEAPPVEHQNMIQLPNTMLVEVTLDFETLSFISLEFKLIYAEMLACLTISFPEIKNGKKVHEVAAINSWLMKTMVLLEIVDIRNLPADQKGKLLVSVNKKQPDLLFNSRRRLTILPEAGKKQVAGFQCEPNGDLLFELISDLPSDLSKERSSEVVGTTSISLQDLFNPVSKLSLEKWFEVVPASGIADSNPISLRIALSVTPPVPAPYVLELHMGRGHPFSRSSSFFPLPKRVQQANNWTSITDRYGNEVISIQMRHAKKQDGSNKGSSKKEVIGMTRSGETCVLADFIRERWFLMGSQWFSQLQRKDNKEHHIFELVGGKKMTIYNGRKLQYEINSFERKGYEGDFMTIVEFSDENPYGKAVALLNLRSGFIKVTSVEEQRLVLPAITLAFILHDILRNDGYVDIHMRHEQIGFQEEDHVSMGIASPGAEGTRDNIGTVRKGIARGDSGGGHDYMVKRHFFSGWTADGACGGSGCGSNCGGGGGGNCHGGSCGGSGCRGGGGCGGGGGCRGGGGCSS